MSTNKNRRLTFQYLKKICKCMSIYLQVGLLKCRYVLLSSCICMYLCVPVDIFLFCDPLLIYRRLL